MNHPSTLFLDRKKRFSGALLASFFCCVGPFLTAQSFSPSVVSAGGGRVSTAEMTLDWTLGETFASRFECPSGRFTEGFHQPTLKVETMREAADMANERALSSAERDDFSFVFWPNPTTGTLVARVDSKTWSSASVILTAADGQTIQKTEQPTNANFEIQFGERPDGLYFLHFFSPDGQSLGARKITLIK